VCRSIDMGRYGRVWKSMRRRAKPANSTWRHQPPMHTIARLPRRSATEAGVCGERRQGFFSPTFPKFLKSAPNLPQPPSILPQAREHQECNIASRCRVLASRPGGSELLFSTEGAVQAKEQPTPGVQYCEQRSRFARRASEGVYLCT